MGHPRVMTELVESLVRKISNQTGSDEYEILRCAQDDKINGGWFASLRDKIDGEWF